MVLGYISNCVSKAWDYITGEHQRKAQLERWRMRRDFVLSRTLDGQISGQEIDEILGKHPGIAEEERRLEETAERIKKEIDWYRKHVPFFEVSDYSGRETSQDVK